MSDPLDWLDQALDELDQRQLRRVLQTRTSPQRPEAVEFAGTSLVNFSANNYLGLAADPRLIRAAQDATQRCGWGGGASPLISGRGREHAELERELAEAHGCDAALLFSSGYCANVGVISALVGRGDVILSDQRNHASIIDGCRLSGAHIEIISHGRVDAYRDALRQATSFRRRLIAIDSLFSMDGDLAPLTALAELAAQHRAMLLVDEAHATGVFGQGGTGVVESLGLQSAVPVRLGTLSKALGGSGGFVVGSQRLIDWLTHRARTYFFSTSAPEAGAAAARAALRIVRDEPHRRQRLLHMADGLRAQLRSAGWDTANSASQIVPVIIGDPALAMQRMQQLCYQGMLVPAIRPPSVAPGRSLLRISLSYSHSDEHVQRLVDALGNATSR